MARVLVLAVALVLSGCATQSERGGARECGDLAGEQQLELRLVRQSAEEGRLHAALAQLEALPPHALEVRYLKAELSRRLRLPEAEALYRGLLGTCMAGRAHHGLGLLAAGEDLAAAEQHLLEARRLLPLDTRVRSDLGYLLLLLRRPEAAAFELRTALELDAANARAARNLLLVYLSERDMAHAAALIEAQGLDDQLADVERELRRLRSFWSDEHPPNNDEGE